MHPYMTRCSWRLSAHDIDSVVAKTRLVMREAAATVLGGFELRTDVKVVRYPRPCFEDDRGSEMWNLVTTILQELEPEQTCRTTEHGTCRGGDTSLLFHGRTPVQSFLLLVFSQSDVVVGMQFPQTEIDRLIRDSPPPPRHRKGERFLRGPIPLPWLQRAATLPGKALAAGIALWFQAGLTKSARVEFCSKLRNGFGISRQAGYRALTALEGAGLVDVERRRGRCARVTLKRLD